MYSCSIQNINGNVLVLTGNEPVYQVIAITGLNPPKAQINTTTIVGLDGAVFNSSKLQTRNIVLTIKINGNVEQNRLNLYQYFRTKEWCKFHYTNASRNVYIEGYVDSVECDLFTNKEIAQISIICPYPYFRDLTEIMTDISSSLALFTFPFSINENEPIPISSYETDRVTNIYNDSESEVGITIRINVIADVSEIELRNINTGEDFTLDYSFEEGDVITINTNKGKKSVSLLRNGTVINLFSALQKGSVFFQLHVGNNPFSYLADNGNSNDNVFILFYHSKEFRGV